MMKRAAHTKSCRCNSANGVTLSLIVLSAEGEVQRGEFVLRLIIKIYFTKGEIKELFKPRSWYCSFNVQIHRLINRLMGARLGNFLRRGLF